MFGFSGGKIIRRLNEDIADSIQFFQDLFDTRLPFERVFVTGIVAYHGQSFDGFLHLPEETFSEERGGASELFRAHEVAHQWWGHLIHRRSYRDQWLSESFAEYSAMMFVEANVENGEKLFAEILHVYHDIVMGSIQSVFSRFSRPELIQMSDKERKRLGPIDVGRRASTRKTPQGYFLQTYYKGALVLHMLRVQLRDQSGGDDLFIAILRDFLKTYRNELASTENFRAMVEKHASGDWGWFFDQWIYGADIPTVRWIYETSRHPDQDGSYFLSVRVRRDGEGNDFIPPIPLRVELEDGKTQDLLMTVQGAEDVYRCRFPSSIKGVELNPDRAFLVRVKKD
jgi:aminopeptidase N